MCRKLFLGNLPWLWIAREEKGIGCNNLFEEKVTRVPSLPRVWIVEDRNALKRAFTTVDRDTGSISRQAVDRLELYDTRPKALDLTPLPDLLLGSRHCLLCIADWLPYLAVFPLYSVLDFVFAPQLLHTWWWLSHPSRTKPSQPKPVRSYMLWYSLTVVLEAFAKTVLQGEKLFNDGKVNISTAAAVYKSRIERLNRSVSKVIWSELEREKAGISLVKTVLIMKKKQKKPSLIIYQRNTSALVSINI